MNRILSLLLLVCGCSSTPTEHPFVPNTVPKVVVDLGEKIHGQTVSGWPGRIELEDDLPAVRLGELNNETDLPLEPRKVMKTLAAALEARDYLRIDEDGGLVLRARLTDPLTKPKKGEERRDRTLDDPYALTLSVEEPNKGGQFYFSVTRDVWLEEQP